MSSSGAAIGITVNCPAEPIQIYGKCKEHPTATGRIPESGAAARGWTTPGFAGQQFDSPTNHRAALITSAFALSLSKSKELRTELQNHERAEIDSDPISRIVPQEGT
jgi:hypothetical protein